MERFAGANRFDTSVILARHFFPDADQAVLAVGNNFPDGLCAGVIAPHLDAPLIVTVSGDRRSYAVDFCRKGGIISGVVLGGSGLISDTTVREVFQLKNEDKIIVYKAD